MRKTVLPLLLVYILVIVLLLNACTNNQSTTTQTTISSAPVPSSSQSATKTPTPATIANWWDKYGTPQYGGTITLATNNSTISVDTWDFAGGGFTLWLESLFEPDWALDRNTWPMTSSFIPDQYYTGNLAESWEITDPQTITVKIHQGVLWQNKAPANGREFTADDVQFHYDRLLGTGHGYTTPNGFFAAIFGDLQNAVATDKYTVVFHFKRPGSQWFQILADRFPLNQFESPEWIALGGPPVNAPADGAPASGPPPGGAPPAAATSETNNPLRDWHNAVGTGPWILSDMIIGSQATYSKNPNYWGHDPRFPKNQTPYADQLKLLIIPDTATQLASLRTGKIDIVFAANGAGGVDPQQAENLTQTNPDLVQGQSPLGANGLTFRLDKAPFTDINVRKALNMAVNRELISNSIYGGFGNKTPCGFVSQTFKGYAYDYADWPQQLKDEYAYNPTQAKKLLLEAGYPNGFKTDISASTADDSQLLQVFKSEFSDIGVDMTINVQDPTTWDASRMASKHDQMITAAGGSLAAPKFTITQFYSKSPDHAYTMVNDANYDALYDKFFSSTDPAAAQNIFRQIDQYVIQQHWLVLAGEHSNYNVWQPYLKGYSGEQIGFGSQVMWSRVWIDQSLKK